YCSADGMIMVAKAVITGHHWGSFQSVQKSQSPANNCLVISAAPATTKIAVTQNTRSHLRSIHLYCFCSSSLSSSRRCRSATSAIVVVPAAMRSSSCIEMVVATLVAFPGIRTTEVSLRTLEFTLDRRCVSVCSSVWTERGFRVRHLFGLLNLKQAQDGLSPHREH